MININEATVVVFTHDELASAISSDNGIDYVYLGSNITLQSGISIHPNKPSLTIDGFYPPDDTGIIYSLTDMDSSSQNSTINVRTASNIDLMFTNMIIVGRNYYGMPNVYNVSGTENVTVSYRNVTYTGPQIIWHQRGLTRFIDCDITISPGFSPMNEVGEVCKVEIGGVTRMRHNSTGYAVFFFYGTNASLTVLEEADVEITTAYDFLYETNPVQITIEQNAAFSLVTERSFLRDSTHRISSFLADENSTFRYIRNTNAGAAHTLYINGAFTVNSGAIFYMQSDFQNSGSLIRFSANTATLNINNPKSFVLYNSGTNSGATALSFSNPTDFNLSGGQLNFWLNATPFPQAGTFDDIPLHKWKKQDWSIFEITGRSMSTFTKIDNTTFTPEELISLPPLSELELQSARVISIGNLPLSVNPIADDQSPVTGITEPNANVKVEFTVGSTDYQYLDAADYLGSFAVNTPMPIPFALNVDVYSNTPFLITEVTRISQDPGELVITAAPEHVIFVTNPIELIPEIILPRRNPYDPVIISDTRITKTEWQLFANITGPLKTSDGDILTDAVVFADDDGTLKTLTLDPIPVFTGGPFKENDISISWNPDKGILARISEPIVAGKVYSTQLNWEVRPVSE